VSRYVQRRLRSYAFATVLLYHGPSRRQMIIAAVVAVVAVAALILL